MANIRIRPNNSIQYDISTYGARFRETSGMQATPVNLKKANVILKQMNAKIALGSFDYREFFPRSKTCKVFEELKRNKFPHLMAPFFDTYANKWMELNKHQWKSSYIKGNETKLKLYLLPYFANTPINEITLASVQAFRSELCELINEDGSKRLSNKRINLILVPLVSMLHSGSDEYDFPYPLEKLKALREEKPDPNPLTQNEVSRFLACVPAFWHDYYLIRFYTGMRSCEVAGLAPEHIDFDQRIIKVRRNFVNGEFTTVKTAKSRRDIHMTKPVLAALQRATAILSDNATIIFANEKGKPIDTRYVSKYVWYPTLAKAGLAPRRPYQTRHTSAVLHLAAHENPLFVSQLLGHSGTKMLYEVYAPYVHNAARSDGSAFEAMMRSPNNTITKHQ